MITIEGLGGKGAVWCAVCFGIGAKSDDSYIDTYTRYQVPYLTASPTTIYLPPVGLASFWHSCTTTPYGARLDQFEIGTLKGVTDSPDTPNPCEHSTMTGSLMSTAIGQANVRWFNPAVAAFVGYTPVLYLPDGSLAEFSQGYAGGKTTSTTYWARDRKGNLVPSDTITYQTNRAMLTNWCDTIGSSNPLFAHGAKQDVWLASAPTWVIPTTKFLHLYKSTCTHVSANVWKEVQWYECHMNASSIPGQPVSEDTGLGFIVVKTQRSRVITMVAIQSTGPTTFKGRYNATETIEYSGSTSGSTHHLISGEVTKEYSFDADILTLEPGLANGGTFIKKELDAYCAQAISRAKLLYTCHNATAARSDAVADVSGLESNWIENLAQAKGTTKVLLPLVEAWKAVKTGNIMLGKRALIDAYLTYMYVVAPGIRDSKDLRDNLGNISRNISVKRFSQERRRGMLKLKQPVLDVTADVAYFCTLELQLKDNPIAALGNALEKLGLSPTASNIWDLIPFSFVADWFVHVGPILSRLDAYNNNALLRDVKCRVETFKVLWPLTSVDLMLLVGNQFSIITDLKYSWYDRRILSGLGSFDPFSGQSFDGLSVSQMTQGGALLSSYKR